MANRRVDRHILWQSDQASIVLTNSTASTSGKTLTAKVFTWANSIAGTTGTSVGTAAGAGIGVSITVPLSLSGVTANAWYALRVYSDLGGATEQGVLPNMNTAEEILIYVRAIP